MPLPALGRGPRRLNDRRDLVQETDDLSDEENELEDLVGQIVDHTGYILSILTIPLA